MPEEPRSDHYGDDCEEPELSEHLAHHLWETKQRFTRYSLLHGEGRRWIHCLLGKVVVHFDLDLVQTRLQVGGG